ncbi:D-glycero-beta-D-manno-heptose 1-phosphate adenylyltransferase [Kitasatospora sp. NPDC048545]|uniref:D-glycero-beta-D-manno-heptose 1-phosphate adenylyltransferase n=1 Tax=Kitasatospora sp. NPDC048545 TaxID=3157208 RepID=UPI0033DBD947
MDIALGVSLPATAQDIGPADTAEGDRTAPLVVIGDALLDRDVVGVVERLSPEAPVPVVDQVEVRSRPGGAGLAAVVAARGTRPVVLVTALATDPAGRELAQLLREHGVQVVDLGLAGPTPVKSRVRADGRSLIMLSQATGRPAPLLRPLSARERTTVLGAAAILVSDYGRGVSEDASVRSAVEAAVSRCPVVWDPHPRGDVPVPGVRLITPNSREAAHFARHVEGSGLRADIDRGLELVRTWSAATVAVTRGADGAVLVDASGTSALVVPCPEVPHGDSAGAGDCFAATAAGLLADGRLVSQAVTRAVAVAAGFVAAGGASSVSDPLPGEGGIRPGADEDALAVVARVRAAGGTVVATGGCFDLLHTGHVALLERARRLGDCLVVCLNDDESVGRLKGPERPVVSAADRAAVLRSLASVDGVVVFPENTPEDALERIRPDIYVKGGDYRIDDVPEAALVEGWGGRTVILPYLDGRSTTNMIDRIARGTSR